MGDILVFVEAQGGTLQAVSLELLSAGRQLAGSMGGKLDALVIGAEANKLAALLGTADRLVAVGHPDLDRYIPEAHAATLAAIVRERNPALVLLAYDSVGLDLAPNLALRTGRPLLGYCTKLTVTGGVLEATSQIYGGKLRAISRAGLPAVATVVPGAFPEAPTASSGKLEIVEITAPPELANLRTRFVSETPPPAGEVDLSQADKILCVGRGIRDKDSIEIVRKVAEALGAEIAGSRPVIDAGWLPRERQVGKSGRKVKPKLYLALGVSGAPEHLEGMSAADLIIAVNSDANAPIFGVAHFGATCDLFDLLPALHKRLGPRGNA
jgi:electron transfer flavoprotein alpha subunit